MTEQWAYVGIWHMPGCDDATAQFLLLGNGGYIYIRRQVTDQDKVVRHLFAQHNEGLKQGGNVLMHCPTAKSHNVRFSNTVPLPQLRPAFG